MELTNEQRFALQIATRNKCYCTFYGKVCTITFGETTVSLDDNTLSLGDSYFQIKEAENFSIGFNGSEFCIEIRFASENLQIRGSY